MARSIFRIILADGESNMRVDGKNNDDVDGPILHAWVDVGAIAAREATAARMGALNFMVYLVFVKACWMVDERFEYILARCKNCESKENYSRNHNDFPNPCARHFICHAAVHSLSVIDCDILRNENSRHAIPSQAGRVLRQSRK